MAGVYFNRAVCVWLYLSANGQWAAGTFFYGRHWSRFIDTYRNCPCIDVDGKAFLSIILELFMEAGACKFIPSQ